ncbi:hypothetical protein DL96DRAFT_1523298 [Flagelloscypha sp. PMI_526]|nr:hypothetical protein DL96DRAFT_1523298 [Flagelloscypha sp. PMI_526]
MFNSPRQSGQRYNSNGLGSSFVDENPLAASTASVYDNFTDPWSNHPSPSQTPAPTAAASGTANAVFNNVIADATVPAVYYRSFEALDPDGNQEVSVNGLTRVLQTSALPASTINKIVNLVSSRPRVSKLEFFVALALVALAQAGKDVSVEQVAALSSQNDLPEPSLDLASLPPTMSTITATPPAVPRSPPAYSSMPSEDPWNSKFSQPPVSPSADPFANPILAGPSTGGASAISGSGMPPNWWKHLEPAHVSVLGQQGFILARYTVYQVVTNRASVTRRYSEFSFLWDCLYKRYPFRLFPALPPKRIGPDEYFLEQRRRGLARSLAFVINHPILKEDGLLNTFLTVPSFEQWRKQASVSLEEESSTKRVDRIEEMSIPSDLEDKLLFVRGKVGPLIQHYQQISLLAERIIKRREAAAVRSSPFQATFRRTHFAFPSLSTSISSAPNTPHPAPSVPLPDNASSVSDVRSMSSSSMFGLTFGNTITTEQSDLARLSNTLRVVNEINGACWRGEACELDNGVRLGLEQVAAHASRHSELAEVRVRALMDTTLEGIKRQRDLYIALRDLFIRHDRLSIDTVERLKKRIETNSAKIETIKNAGKDGWQDQVESLLTSIEKDQASIQRMMQRRVFIRACMWHELRVILHNRENTLLTEVVKNFAREERDFVELVVNNWTALGEAVESMPFE